MILTYTYGLQNGATALMLAVWDGNRAIVRSLIEKRANVNHQGKVNYLKVVSPFMKVSIKLL